jgi:hypothetical protein
MNFLSSIVNAIPIFGGAKKSEGMHMYADNHRAPYISGISDSVDAQKAEKGVVQSRNGNTTKVKMPNDGGAGFLI